MLAAAARIANGVEVPVTVDAEAGYGMEPAELVAALRSAGAAGCNLEDTDHAADVLRDPGGQAEWLGAVRQAASDDGYPLVINARVDVFFGPLLAGAGPGTQHELVPEALGARTRTSRPARTACTRSACGSRTRCARFMAEVRGPVNVVRLPQAPPLAELAALGVARVSWGPLLYLDAMARFDRAARLASGLIGRLRRSPRASSGSAAASRAHAWPSRWRRRASTSPGRRRGRRLRRRGRVGAQRARQAGQPFGLRRRLVVDDVVDPRRAALERRDGRRRGVLDVQPAVNAGGALDERHRPATTSAAVEPRRSWDVPGP